MSEFVHKHIAILREKGPEWQIRVALMAVVVITALSLAALAAQEKPLDRTALAQLASKGSLPAKDKPPRRDPNR